MILQYGQIRQKERKRQDTPESYPAFLDFLVAGVGFEPTAPGGSTETVGDSTEVEIISVRIPRIRSYLLTNSILWYIIY